MNIDELRQLSDWFVLHFSELNSLYGGLLSPIQHNASQQSKQPVESQLDALLAYLREMKFDELSVQQLRMLSSLGVNGYIGRDGANFVESAIRTSDYDPTTAANKISVAVTTLSQAHSAFSAYRASLKPLGLDQSVDAGESHAITIRVGFQNDASIDNVTDWKESAKDWYDIIRGLALASNEAPEDTKVVGASTGSIILILAGTLSVTTLLALISGNVASVAKHVIGIGNQIEDLRHKKLLNSVIERELRKQEQDTKDKALSEIVDAIKLKIPDLDGEKVAGLEGSIKKLLLFNEKGGNVDFVAPEVDGADPTSDPEGNKEIRTALVEARAAIHEYQSVREQIKTLTDMTDKGRL
jgi:hypothetical protein